MSADQAQPDRSDRPGEDSGRAATDRAAGQAVPGETTTGARAGGGSAQESSSPGGAVSGEIGRVPGDPRRADLGGGADLGSEEGDHVRDVAARVRESDDSLEDPPA